VAASEKTFALVGLFVTLGMFFGYLYYQYLLSISKDDEVADKVRCKRRERRVSLRSLCVCMAPIEAFLYCSHTNKFETFPYIFFFARVYACLTLPCMVSRNLSLTFILLQPSPKVRTEMMIKTIEDGRITLRGAVHYELLQYEATLKSPLATQDASGAGEYAALTVSANDVWNKLPPHAQVLVFFLLVLFFFLFVFSVIFFVLDLISHA